MKLIPLVNRLFFHRSETHRYLFGIGDYISLYQQQRQQLHRRYQEKDDYIKQLTHDRLGLQVRILH